MKCDENKRFLLTPKSRTQTSKQKNKTKARSKRRKSLQQVDNGISEGMP